MNVKISFSSVMKLYVLSFFYGDVNKHEPDGVQEIDAIRATIANWAETTGEFSHLADAKRKEDEAGRSIVSFTFESNEDLTNFTDWLIECADRTLERNPLASLTE